MRYLTFLYYSCWKHPTLSSLSLFALAFSLTYWSHSNGMLHNCWHLWTTLSCWHLWTGCPAWQITSQSSALCLSVCVSTVFTVSHHVPKAAESRFSRGAQRGHTEGQNHLLHCHQILTFSLPPLSTYSTEHSHTHRHTH